MEDFIKILMVVFICFMIILAAKYYFENNRKNSVVSDESNEKVVDDSSSEQPAEKIENLTDVNMEKPKFIKSEWVGSKPGYVFYRTDENGLGYHLDK